MTTTLKFENIRPPPIPGGVRIAVTKTKYLPTPRILLWVYIVLLNQNVQHYMWAYRTLRNYYIMLVPLIDKKVIAIE